MTTPSLAVERVEFADGNWWEFHAEITRGMRKAFRAAAMRALTGGIDGQEPIKDIDDFRRLVLTRPDRLDLNAIDDAYLSLGTTAWSFGAEIMPETIDALPERYIKPVLARMQALYAEATEEAAKK